MTTRCVSRGRRALSGAMVTASAMCALLAPPVAAQTATPEEASDPLNTIIVTAQKREESIQDVPLSISAISSEELNARGATNFADIARAVPGISFFTSGGDGIRPILRGVNSIGTGAPTVAIYLDDAPIQVRDSFRGGGGAADIQLIDLDRVEILRGPQGTLYGGSSLGGAIKYVTRAPSLTNTEGQFASEVATTKGGEASFAIKGAFSTPIVSDMIGLRASISFRRDGGWIDRVDPFDGTVVDENVDRANQLSGRVALLLEPTERFSITASYFGQRNDIDALSYSNSAIGIGFYDNRLPETARDELHLGAIRFQYDLDTVALFGQASYLDRRYRRAEDYSVVLVDAGLVDALGVPADTTIANLADQKQRGYTGELRVASQTDGPLQWTVGGYFSKSKLFSRQTIDVTDLGELLFQSLNDQDDEQYAVFGEASYRFANIVTLTLGARYSWLTVDVGRQALGLLGDAGAPPSLFTRKDDSFDPKVNISVQAGPETILYAQAARGFRPGEASSLLPDSCSAELQARGITDTNGFGPDKIWTYEGGIKTTFLNERARVNVSAYYSDWSDKPESIGLNSCGFSATLPVGKVEITGFEFESEFAPADWALFSLNVGYTNPTFSIDEPSLEIVDGDRLGLVSRWTVSASSTFSAPISQSAELSFRADYLWRSSALVVGESIVFPTVTQRETDPYDILNLRLSYDRGNLNVFAFAENLTNERPVIGVDELTPVSVTADRVSSIRPRTIGIGLGYNF